jgi:hypothetical protein
MNTSYKSRYINPKTDLAFKLVFGNNVERLKSFLNALLPLPADAQIEQIEVGKDHTMVDANLLSDPLIAKALKIVEVAALSPVQLAQYNQELDKIRMDTLDAREAGLAQGLSEGKAQGLAEGELKGKVELIKAMYDKGMSLGQIGVMTGYNAAQLHAYLDSN